MAQVVITDFQLKIDQYLQQLEKLKAKVRTVIQEREKDKQAEQKNVKELQNAVQQRSRLLQQELNLLKKLQSDRAKAFTVKEIEQYNQKIAETQRNIRTLQGATSDLSGTAGKLKGAFASLGAGIAAAFSAQSIINFSKQTIDAFLEAQKSAELLKFAIVDIGGESEAQFNRLIRQSEKLQKTTIFGDDQIQQAQAALSAFGLTTNQIEELIPKLADIATILKTDIVGAANQVGAGLQGAGREFKRLGIDVSSSKTELENLNSILEGAGKFSGTAAKAAETLSGQLEQQKNAANDLQEEIGSKLAPAYIKAKVAVLEFISTLLSANQNAIKSIGFTSEQARELEKLGFSFDEQRKSAKETANSNKEVAAQMRIGANQILLYREQVERFNEQIALGNTSLKDLIDYNKSYREVLKELNIPQKSRLIILQMMADAEEELIQKQRKRTEEESQIIKASDLKKKSIEELNNLLEENKKINTIIGQSNVQLLEKEIELRNKAAEDAKKKLEQTRQELLRQEQSIISLINKIRLEQATPEEKLQIQFEIDKESIEKSKEDVRNAAEIEKSIEAKKLEAKKLLNQKYTSDILAEIEKQLAAEDKAASDALKERLRIEADGQRLLTEQRLAAFKEGSVGQLNEQKKILEEERDEKLKNIARTVKDDTDAQQQILLTKIDYAKKIGKIDEQIADKTISENEKAKNKVISLFNEISQYALQVFTAIATIQANDSQQRIDQLTEEGTAQQDALDKEIESLNKQRQGKYIGEKDYQEKLKRLEDQKLANEKKIQAEINKEKRKQAETERQLRVFEIAINTASGIIKAVSASPLTFGQPWASFIAALGALQTAAVLSAPLPKFEKGTKGKKDSGLAVVGERGEEIVNLPRGSQVLHNKGYKKHREAINAMMDNRFEEYVYSKFVIPEVRKIRERSIEHRKQEQKEIYLTSGGIDEYGMRRVAREGIRVINAQEIAELIAGQMQSDIRRRI